MFVAVVGLGFVGLTLSLALVEKGIKVAGIEINQKAYEKLSKGISTINESGVERYLKKNLGKNFQVFSKLEDLKEKPEFYVLCVATPIKSNSLNTDHLIRATKSIGKVMTGEELVIVRSTSPVGTTRQKIIPELENELKKRGITKKIKIAYAPERALSGVALKELTELPQIVSGIDSECSSRVMELFRKLTPTIIQVSSLEAAEMIKLIDNSFRDVRFAYANEIMLLCEQAGVDAHECIKNANTDYERNNIPLPSPGVGGPCLSKDPYLLVEKQDIFKSCPNLQSLILSGRRINESIPVIIAQKIKKQIAKKNSKIFVMGFAFKGEPETIDTRNSSTLDLVKNLINEHRIFGHDPVVPNEILSSLNVTPTNLEEGFQDADCVIIMNNHKNYRNLDILTLLERSSKPCIFVDCWRLYDKKIFEKNKSVIYSGIGIV
jgi:UDP-N-acetyl-D-mannosaminuronic acid dehydrogenase